MSQKNCYDENRLFGNLHIPTSGSTASKKVFHSVLVCLCVCVWVEQENSVLVLLRLWKNFWKVFFIGERTPIIGMSCAWLSMFRDCKCQCFDENIVGCIKHVAQHVTMLLGCVDLYTCLSANSSSWARCLLKGLNENSCCKISVIFSAETSSQLVSAYELNMLINSNCL